MALPQPYRDADDEVVVEGCLRGESEALGALFSRHGALAELAVRREIGAGTGDEPDALDTLRAYLSSEGELALRSWTPAQATLRAFLCALARRSTRSSRAGTRVSLLMPRAPTPIALDLTTIRDEAATLELTRQVRDGLGRHPPNVVALVRMRLRGLEVARIAALVGSTPAQVEASLARVASRFAQIDVEHSVDDELIWRALFAVLAPAERVRLALGTEKDPSLSARRARLESVFRQMEGSTLAVEPPPHPSDLDIVGIAGFVDGTMRGAARARAESQVIASPRALDEVAALAMDLRALPLMRETGRINRPSLVAAMALASGLIEAGAQLAERALDDVGGVTTALARIGRAARMLSSGAARSRDVSGMVLRELPPDNEVALVAFESLALGDAGAALRAIDDEGAQAPVAARLRGLAAAASGDGELARRWAEGTRERYDVDPGAVEDADLLLALEPGEILPRESLVERLRSILPDLVRATLLESARSMSPGTENR